MVEFIPVTMKQTDINDAVSKARGIGIRLWIEDVAEDWECYASYKINVEDTTFGTVTFRGLSPHQALAFLRGLVIGKAVCC